MTNYPASNQQPWANLKAAKAYCVCCRATIEPGEAAVSQISGVIFAHDGCLTTLRRGVGDDTRRLMTLGTVLRR
jgi:hypothetical protein